MQTKRFADLELSQLMLGTVQFGLNYGIANRSGQPSYETARDILACAYEGGVNCLDTAAAYGTSEEVLGKALVELGIADKTIVVSKIYPMAKDFSSTKAADAFVEESVTKSLRRLRLDVLPICLFHREENFCYIESLLKLKDKGLVRHIGASVMTPEATSVIISSGLAEAVQIPANILDHRFTRSGICGDAKKQGMAVFVRSVYLQGLILMPEDEILPELAEVIPIRRKLQCLADDAGMSLKELAIRYVLSIGGLTCALVGVDSVQQMRQNLELFSNGLLDSVLIKAITDVVPNLSDNVLMPNMWSKRIPDIEPEKQ